MPTKVLFLSLTLVLVSGVLAYSSKSSFQNSYNKGIGTVYGLSTATMYNLPEELLLPTDARIVSSSAGIKGSQITFETVETDSGVQNLITSSLLGSGWVKNNDGGLSRRGQTLNLQVTPPGSNGLTVVTLSYLLGS